MTRTFIILPEFDKNWKSMNLGDEDLKELQERLLLNPKLGDTIQGTGGLRKLRIALENRGKRSGCRVCYVDVEEFNCIYLITAYPKNVKDDLTQAEQKNIAKVIQILKNERRKKQ